MENLNQHTFAVCAYKDSPYLEECFRSLKEQTVKTKIICCTSTPSPYIDALTKKYGISLFVRDGKSNIREDWLFAWKMADSELVTIAHQDDRYGKRYAEILLKSYEKYPDMTVFMSDYVTIKMQSGVTGSERADEKERNAAEKTGQKAEFQKDKKERRKSREKLERYNKVWLVKKILRLPLRLRILSDCRVMKRSALIFGNSICCPSCTYNKKLIRREMFQSQYDFALDWDNLYELAGDKGRFICSEQRLLGYRVHDGATTKACIEDHRRMNDEIAMFEKMWPKWMVRILMHYYKRAYSEYES